MTKPVYEVTPETMWNYKYQAKHYGQDLIIIASDSLINLKSAVKEYGWKLAWITITEGCFSYGQNLVEEYPYQPRYK